MSIHKPKGIRAHHVTLRPAVNTGQPNSEEEIRARAVRYVPERDAIEIVTYHNAGLLIPRHWVGALQGVSPEDLRKLDIWPDGSAIEIEDRDIHISVHGLVTATVPAIIPSPVVDSVFGSQGGQTISPAKRASSRKNGRKAGRRRKGTRTPETA